MNLNEDDSVFNDIILIDGGVTESDDNIEESAISTKTTKTKYARTTKEQFERLLSYMGTHEDFVQGKPGASQQLEWDSFVVDLNDIGPPYRKSEEWKVVWSNHKNNRKRRQMSRKKPPAKISCTPETFKSFENANSSTEKVAECAYGHLALENYPGCLAPEKDAAHLENDSRLAVEEYSVHLVMENDSNRLALDGDAGHLALERDSIQLALENDSRLAVNKDSDHLVLENDSSRLALDGDDDNLALENDSSHLVLDNGSVYLVVDPDDPDTNRDKMKISYVEEDKENFHSKVLNKLDVLIKEQQQSNQNIAEFIKAINKKYDDQNAENGKKKKKKNKNLKVAEDGNNIKDKKSRKRALNTGSDEGTAKKKKNKNTANGTNVHEIEDESGTNANSEEQNSKYSADTIFDWQSTIVTILSKKTAPMAINKLMGKVVKKYALQTTTVVSPKVEKKFLKKLKTTPNVTITNKFVELVK